MPESDRRLQTPETYLQERPRLVSRDGWINTYVYGWGENKMCKRIGAFLWFSTYLTFSVNWPTKNSLPDNGVSIISPFLQTRKLRLRKMKSIAQMSKILTHIFLTPDSAQWFPSLWGIRSKTPSGRLKLWVVLNSLYQAFSYMCTRMIKFHL